MPFSPPAAVLVTGACGNLGRKVVEALAATAGCSRVVGLDRIAAPDTFSPAAKAKLVLVTGDLTHPAGSWADAFAGVQAVIHFAAQNPDVDASWIDAANSLAMTVNVGMAAMKHGVGRLVFASSNHVMGGYKDAPLSSALEQGTLSTSLPPAPGTKWHDGTRLQDSTPYATAKLMGEQVVTTFAANSAGAMTGVSVRIGWAQPGANRPGTISHAGSIVGGIAQAYDAAARRDLRWFRNMWLANADLAALFLAAVSADASAWPSPGITVNGMSDNSGMDWDLSSARQFLGYRPTHDLYAELEHTARQD